MENIHNDIKKVLITAEEIDKACEKLATKLDEIYSGKKPVILSLLRGSVPFSVALTRHMKIQIETDYMRASSYAGTSSTGNVNFIVLPQTDLNGRDVIIVEDIIDTGLTLKEIKKALLTKYNLNSLIIVTMLDKPEMRKVPDINPDYNLFTIPNEFVVGFGLDYNEDYRNLPYVGVLKEEVYQK